MWILMHSKLSITCWHLHFIFLPFRSHFQVTDRCPSVRHPPIAIDQTSAICLHYRWWKSYLEAIFGSQLIHGTPNTGHMIWPRASRASPSRRKRCMRSLRMIWPRASWSSEHWMRSLRMFDRVLCDCGFIRITKWLDPRCFKINIIIKYNTRFNTLTCITDENWKWLRREQLNFLVCS